MPKKDTSSAVLGMLSSAGAQTRPVTRSGPTTAVVPALIGAVVVDETVDSPPPPPPSTTPVSIVESSRDAWVSPAAGARESAPVTSTSSAAGEPAPRTIRLRPGTAQALRDAWLEAKRDDVLLTAQDFASALVDGALAQRTMANH